jgi:hypothetical protein
MATGAVLDKKLLTCLQVGFHRPFFDVVRDEFSAIDAFILAINGKDSLS